MSCLLYGIVFSRLGGHAGGSMPEALPPGVGGAPVRLIEDRGLAAAVSTIEARHVTPNVERTRAYARVVEALHTGRAVLPMRYGCVLGEESQVIELLREHGEEYAAILSGLDGCVEMGVRVLLPAEPAPPPFVPYSDAEATSGRAYLARLRDRYAGEEAIARELAAVTERLRGPLGGLAEKTAADRRIGTDPRLASLYFLVRRERVEAFREAFRRIEPAEPARLLLSGPWPPYNFVTPDGDRNGHG